MKKKKNYVVEANVHKLKELEESYARELKEWKADLKPRKQVPYRHSYSHTSTYEAHQENIQWPVDTVTSEK